MFIYLLTHIILGPYGKYLLLFNCTIYPVNSPAAPRPFSLPPPPPHPTREFSWGTLQEDATSIAATSMVVLSLQRRLCPRTNCVAFTGSAAAKVKAVHAKCRHAAAKVHFDPTKIGNICSSNARIVDVTAHDVIRSFRVTSGKGFVW